MKRFFFAAAVLMLLVPLGLSAQKKPVIGVSCSIDGSTVEAGMTYVVSVRKAGGIPFVIPLTTSGKEIDEYLDRIDGLLMIGGEDVSPLLFGQQPSKSLGEVVPDRDIYDLALIRKAVKRGIPVLGICRGIQCLNIAMGGDLIQDIPSEVQDAIQHRQNAPRSYGSHTITITKGSLMANLLGVDEIAVNSFHHQACGKVAPGYKVTARASDGVIEAIESADGKSFGVQFHPEGFVYSGKKEFLPIFQHLVKLAGEYAASR
ncbi:MAG: gamma-glutamyl-gamma-aminobutyrate hydrolase family protein [Bacteroidales bacterium]|nr:gamma-glutamyl-gamma-aminobutyrate hydrolase family protein [Bacteroidales bacterium]